MAEENKDVSETKAMPLHIPENTWPVIVILVMLALGALIYYSFGKHEHVSQGQFVGPGKCKTCHEKQYASWKKTRMANSFNMLRPGVKGQEKQMVGLNPDKDYTQDETCLPCHTTGYGLVGGFVSIEKTPDMAGVSCEACHGHGGTYVSSVMSLNEPKFQTSDARKAGLVYPPTENVCRVCHNARSPYVGMDYKFYYDERVKLGTHEHYHLKYEHGR
ncbi:MAG: hypothetical protein A2X96_05015 [Syntrophobacterales bacterium GWC2_56_13]|nr:MAG: hypothetical protein A2X96_05015 [Syntrophobacterales bacterium GWC2_56_13]OHE19890.1 MAG: hypothetical protein A2X95_07680 [Syntrophobacterales bacterium GWF2_56_9]